MRVSVRRFEWVFVVIVAAVLVLLSLLPTLFGLWREPAGHRFLYNTVPDIEDTQVYLSFIDQNASGHVLYPNLYTSEAQRPTFFHPLWLLLGGFERLFGLSPAVVYTLSRLALGVVLVFVIYWTTSFIFTQVGWRRVATLMAVWASGLGGWVVGITLSHDTFVSYLLHPKIFQSLPIDLSSTAAFPALAIQSSPRPVLSQILQLLIGLLFLRALDRHQWRAVHWAGALALLATLIHPYESPLIVGVLAAWWIVSVLFDFFRSPADAWWHLRAWLMVTAWVLVGWLYYGWALWREPVLRAWNAQNQLPMSNGWTVLIGLGLLTPLAIMGVRAMWFNQRRAATLLSSWAIVTIVMLYLPFIPFQQKLIAGLGIPITLLATAGLRSLWAGLGQTWTQEKPRWVMRTCLVVITILGLGGSNAFFLWQAVRTETRETEYFYAPTDLVDALTWIRASTPTSSVVLGDYRTGNMIPAQTGRVTYLGQVIQTIHYRQKLDLVRHWFFATDGEQQEKASFLRQAGITYVVWGPYERRWGAFQPDHIPTLRLAYHNASVSVYAVTH